MSKRHWIQKNSSRTPYQNIKILIVGIFIFYVMSPLMELKMQMLLEKSCRRASIINLEADSSLLDN